MTFTDPRTAPNGPLAGLRVIELGGIGPVPFAAMLLSDLGAQVVKILRPGEDLEREAGDLMNRGKRGIVVDLKTAAGKSVVRSAIRGSDVLLEGFRPGVAERLGFGPNDCHDANGKLVYGRMSGWGRTGPLASAPGHDINYIALAGALSGVGQRFGPPTPPLSYVGDFGGGAMSLTVGVLGALWNSRESGVGDVVDGSILDGATLLTLPIWNFLHRGEWNDLERGVNVLDGGAPYYTVYATADQRFISLGPMEDQFFNRLVDILQIDTSSVPDRHDPTSWTTLRRMFEDVFAQRTESEWRDLLENADVCFAPVLPMSEAPGHPHNAARGTFVEAFGRIQPAPTPRFSNSRLGAPTAMSIVTDLSDAWDPQRNV